MSSPTLSLPQNLLNLEAAMRGPPQVGNAGMLVQARKCKKNRRNRKNPRNRDETTYYHRNIRIILKIRIRKNVLLI